MLNPHIDVSVFQELQDTAGAEFVVELLDALMEEAPLMLASLRSSLASGQDEVFRRAAHSLKSNSESFGAMKLAGMARELELGGIASVPTPEAALGALEAEYAQAVTALKELSRG